MARSNRYAEAFKEGANLLGMTGIVAASIVALNPLPLLVGLAAETAYLLFIPDSKWYGHRLSRREMEAVLQRRKAFRDQTVPQLRDQMRERYLHLETVSEQIRAQAVTDKRYYGDILPKLDYLLDKFLVFAVKEAQFRAYLKTIWEECHGVSPQTNFENPQSGLAGLGKLRLDSGVHKGRASETVAAWVPKVVGEVQAHYQEEIDNLTTLEASETDSNTKAVLVKRIDVLKQRHEFVEKIGRILTNLNYQMELLEDTFGLINDQIRARSPEQVLSEIEGVVFQTDSMTQLLEELAPFEQLTSAAA
jgi:hypothetical protein